MNWKKSIIFIIVGAFLLFIFLIILTVSGVLKPDIEYNDPNTLVKKANSPNSGLEEIPVEIETFYQAYNDEDYETIKNLMYEEYTSRGFNSLDGFVGYVKEYRSIMGENVEYKLSEVHEPVGDNDWTIYILKSKYENNDYGEYSIDYTYYRDDFTLIEDPNTGKTVIRSYSPPSIDSILKNE